jgi:hypothetical protein
MLGVGPRGQLPLMGNRGVASSSARSIAHRAAGSSPGSGTVIPSILTPGCQSSKSAAQLSEVMCTNVRPGRVESLPSWLNLVPSLAGADGFDGGVGVCG